MSRAFLEYELDELKAIIESTLTAARVVSMAHDGNLPVCRRLVGQVLRQIFSVHFGSCSVPDADRYVLGLLPDVDAYLWARTTTHSPRKLAELWIAAAQFEAAGTRCEIQTASDADYGFLEGRMKDKMHTIGEVLSTRGAVEEVVEFETMHNLRFEEGRLAAVIAQATNAYLDDCIQNAHDSFKELSIDEAERDHWIAGYEAERPAAKRAAELAEKLKA